MTQLKAVFFDAAGTLFEPREPVALSYAMIARQFGMHADTRTVDQAFRRVFHDSPPLAFGPGYSADELRRLERQWWRNLVEKTFAGLGKFSDFEAYFDALFSFFANPDNWVVDAGAASLMAELHERGLIVGVISNFDHRLYRILHGLGLSPCFDSVTISSEAGFAKPSPMLFTAALALHHVTPDQAVHVGDSEHLDQAGATAAGIRAILVDHEMQQPLRVAGRTARVSSLGAVREVLREWAPEAA
jgi:putative hydrolase of the HAD superfamily